MERIKLILRSGRLIVKTLSETFINLTGIKGVKNNGGSIVDGVLDATLQEMYEDAQWFTDNAEFILLEGQRVNLLQTGTYKLGDGVTQVQNLIFLGSTSQDFQEDIDKLQSTSVISGTFSINTDTTKFDCNVVGQVRNPTTGVVTTVTKADAGQSFTYFPTTRVTYIGIDVNGSYIMQSTRFTVEQRYSLIGEWGLVYTGDGVNLIAINEYITKQFNIAQQLHNNMASDGVVALNGGCQFFASPTTALAVRKTSGIIKGLGWGSGDPDNPHQKSFADSGLDLVGQNRYSAGIYTASTSLINPTIYEFPLGTPGTIVPSPNDVTVIRFTIFQSGLVRWQMGQTIFPNINDAVINTLANTNSYVSEQNISDSGCTTTFLAIQKNCTSWTQTTRYQFFVNPQTGGTSATQFIPTLQAVTDIGSSTTNNITVPKIQQGTASVDMADGLGVIVNGDYIDAPGVYNDNFSAELYNGSGLSAKRVKIIQGSPALFAAPRAIIIADDYNELRHDAEIQLNATSVKKNGSEIEIQTNKTGTITGNESSTTLYSHVKGLVDWVKQGLTSILPSKTTPVDADGVLINDSADSNKTKLTTWADIKTTLKAYFDGFYTAKPRSSYNFTPFNTTNTTAEEIAHSHQIASGLIITGNDIEILAVSTNVSSANTKTYRMYVNTSNSLSGATLIATAAYTTAAGYAPFWRKFRVLSDTSIFSPNSPTNSLSSWVSASATGSSNVTVPSLTAGFWVIITSQKSSGAESVMLQNSSVDIIR